MKQTKNRNKTKICIICGKAEAQNSNRHQDVWHPKVLERFQELPKGQDPKNPWCQNWKEVANDGAIPIDIVTEFKEFYKHIPKSVRGSVKGSVQGSQVGTLDFDRMKDFDEEKLKEKKENFQTPKKQFDTNNIGSAFKQPLQTNLIRTQVRNGQTLFSTLLGPNQGQTSNLNALAPYINQALATQRINLTSLQVPANTLPYDAPFGFVEVKDNVGQYIQDISKIKGSLPSHSSKAKTTAQSVGSVIEQQKQLLHGKQEWRNAATNINECLFEGTCPNYDYGMCFLVQAAELHINCAQLKHPSFVPALAKALEIVTVQAVPLPLLQLFADFIEEYQVELSHENQHLKQIFMLASRIGGDLNWLKQVEQPHVVVAEDGVEFRKYVQFVEVVQLFMSYPQLYSWDYIKLMKSQLDDSGQLRVRSLTTFLNILSNSQVTFVPQTLPKLLEAFITVAVNTLPVVEQTALEILEEMSVEMGLLLNYIDVALSLQNVGAVIDHAKKGFAFQSKEQLLAIVNLEASKQQKIKEEEEQMRTVAEEEQQRLQRLEEEKKYEELQKEQFAFEQQQLQVQEEQKVKDDRLQHYHELCTLNNMAYTDDQTFLEFTDKMVAIAARLPKVLVEGVLTTIVPRADQLADMHLSLNSTKQLTLSERPTGTGKSLEIALMALYTADVLGNKALILVPSEVLKLDQIRLYCPSVCKVESGLYDSSDPAIYYKTFDEALADGRIPDGTVILIDEFHEFMKLLAQWIENRINCPYLFAAAQKVIGLSATFGGEQVKSDLNKLFPSSMFLQGSQQAISRKLGITVEGKLDEATVIAKAAKMATEQAVKLPVIIFHSKKQHQELKVHLPQAEVFSGIKVAEQLSMLRDFRTAPTSPNYIVLSSGNDCLGLTLFQRAFIIFTYTPDTLEELRQLAGRGERGDPNTAVSGAMFITDRISSIEDLELAMVGAEVKQRSLQLDYPQSLTLLQKCEPTTGAQQKALQQAVAALNERKSHNEIAAILSKTAFKKNIDFKVPANKKVEVLGKRTPPQNSNIQDFYKRKNIEIKEGDDLPENWIELEQELEDLQEDEAMMYHDEPEMHQLAGELSEGVLEEKEKQMALELMAKYNLGGKQAAGSGTASPQSKTSSQILFGKEEDTAGIIRRKREQKQWEKESVKSGESQHSKVSRSTNGRFEGGTTFNDQLFVKAGMSKGGHQQWKCTTCQKKTVTPLSHQCV